MNLNKVWSTENFLDQSMATHSLNLKHKKVIYNKMMKDLLNIDFDEFCDKRLKADYLTL